MFLQNSKLRCPGAKSRTWPLQLVITVVGKLFTQSAKFGKTVEAVGRNLIEKRGKDLFFGNLGPRTNVISKTKGFHLVFLVFYLTAQMAEW